MVIYNLNKMQFRKYIFISLLLIGFQSITAQEILTGLNKNPEIINAPDYIKHHKSSIKGNSNSEIKLPMIDDFSEQILFPNDKYWSSRNTFINRSYAVNPPSIGVMTFDAIDQYGAVYPNMTSFSSVADTLASNNIRLDSLFGNNAQILTPADSVYLSFAIQPQGVGSAPLEGDSIVLQFYNPASTEWKSVWKLDGMPLDSFRLKYDTSFIQVMIPITNPDYFAADFKFRFYNYAHVPSPDKPSWRSGMFSHWNIDYLVLDAHRTYSDTSYYDMAIQTIQNSLLEDYTSMPWNQYQAGGRALMKHGLGIRYKNMDNIPTLKNVNQYFFIFDLWNKSQAFVPNPNPSAANVGSQVMKSFVPNYDTFHFYTSNPSPKYQEFQVLYNIFTNSSAPDIIRSNDTMSFYQNFYNYLSYDDGIPEAGYGLSVNNARLAYQFKLNTPDTLQSIEMYFNQTLGDANQQYFYLTVWDDNNGSPGNVIYERSGRRPEFQSELFKYYTYVLDNPILVSGTIYIGWRQTTKDNLNIGFDFSNDQSSKIFYNVTGSWINSGYKGCIMMRPILGSEKYAHVGFEDIKEETNKTDFKVYPNPSEGVFNIELQNTQNSQKHINIFDLSGRIVYSNEYSQKINLKDLSPGIYIMQLTDNKGLSKQKKIIISR
jgi:hypothetical protein